MEDIECRAMRTADLHIHMLDSFDRRQEITRELGKHGRVKRLGRPRVEDWSGEDKANFIRGHFIHQVWLRRYYPGEPLVFAAFRGDQVVGFANWWLRRERGAETDEAVLMNLYVSNDCRRLGLGRRLFTLVADAARASGARTLFIYTRPAAETQAFYREMGCVPAGKAICKRFHEAKDALAKEFLL